MSGYPRFISYVKIIDNQEIQTIFNFEIKLTDDEK